MNRKSAMGLPSKKRLIVLAGPTAVGKTALAISLAKRLNTEIISCDSRQLYKELNIGVARPTAAELAQVKHHFIANKSIHQGYSAGEYGAEAKQLINELFKKYDDIILTGGTGLYIKAVIEGLDYKKSNNQALREKLTILLEESGIAALQSRAQKLNISDSHHAFQNPQRLIRTIELEEAKLHGSLELHESDDNDYLVSSFYVNRDRTELYERINKRVEMMLAAGLEEEAKSLYPYRHLNALKTVGYTEFFHFFDGEWTKEKTIDKLKQHTRNYAKRQLTWFRNQGNFIEIDPNLESLLYQL